MKLPDFNLFSDKSALIFLIFPSICPNFYGFPNFWGAVASLPPLSRTPMVSKAANKQLGVLKRTCPSLTEIKVRRTLYLSLVKS